MTILQGTMQDGTVLPVQVDAQGRLVAEGLQGAPGPEGPEGPVGGSFALPPNPQDGDALVWTNGALAWQPLIPPPDTGPVTSWLEVDPGIQSEWRAITYGGSTPRFVAVSSAGTDRVITSEDGTTWTGRGTAGGSAWYGVTWSPEQSLFVAVGVGGHNDRAMTSPDGINWTVRSTPGDHSSNYMSVAWGAGAGQFVAVSQGGTSRIMQSPNGTDWTTRSAPEDLRWSSVCWSQEKSLFVAVGDYNGGRTMYSSDGINWTLGNAASENVWQQVIWVKELDMFVACSSGGDLARIMTSSDGITWTGRVTPGDQALKGLAWSPERSLLVAVNATDPEGRVLQSVDGINWGARATPNPPATFTDVVWGASAGQFVAVAHLYPSGRFLTSTGF